MATWFVCNWLIVVPAGGGPGKPYERRVLNGLESVSTIEIVLFSVFTVMICPVCGLIASDVGLMPTRTLDDAPVSGLNELTRLPPLETA